MFASLGFKVDTSGLDKFKKAISSARSEMTNLGQGTRTATRQFRNLRRETDKLSESMGKIKNAGGTRSVGGSYRQLAADVWKVRNALDSIATNQPKTTKAIGRINASVVAGLSHWGAYRRNIVQTRQSLANLNGDLARLRANSRIDVRINQNNRGGGGTGGGSGGGGGLGGAAAGLGLRGFFGNFLPSMALASVGAGAGFVASKTISTAREQTSMESMILMTSKSAAEFKDTVDYINTEAKRLGLNAADLGRSFAQVSMSAGKTLSSNQKKEMFTGISEFLMSMGTNADDQKGIFRAINQMFSNNRILQEEINQLSDRGIPATLIYDGAMKAYGLDTVAQVKKLQEAGKLDPAKVWTTLSKMLQEKAHTTGAYDKMQNSSMFKQNQFMAESRAAAKELMDSGLDKSLGDLFGVLTQVVVKLKEALTITQEFSKGLRVAKDWINQFTGGADFLSILLLVLITRFGRASKAVGFATRNYRRNRDVLRSLSLFMTGTFGKAVGRMIFRFGLWGIAIYAVSKAFTFLYDQINRSKKGEWTFFDETFSAVERLSIKFDIMVAKFKLAMWNMKVAVFNPYDVWNNQETTTPLVPAPSPYRPRTPEDLTRQNSISETLRERLGSSNDFNPSRAVRNTNPTIINNDIIIRNQDGSQTRHNSSLLVTQVRDA